MAERDTRRGTLSTAAPPDLPHVGTPDSPPDLERGAPSRDAVDADLTASPLGGSSPGPTAGAGASTGRRGDRIFAGVTSAAGIFALVIIVAIFAFLVKEAVPALSANKGDFFGTRTVQTTSDTSLKFGIPVLLAGTVVSSLIALLLAVPVALGVALWVTQYAGKRVARPVGYLVDLLAAVPSVVYGLFALFFLAPRFTAVQKFLSVHLGWIPFFDKHRGGLVAGGTSLLLAGVILAVMIIPIIAAISREVFVQVPTANREAALALGATRMEMIRMAVLPFSRAGVVSAVMLGLGRALGETIAVALVLSTGNRLSLDVLGTGNSIAANIATQFGEASAKGRGALVSTGLVLFVITLVVNLMARGIVYRSNRISTKGSA